MNAPHERTYYPALDGLRGLAILLVVFYHNFGFTNYSLFGWLGVDLFFVISGFLITEILIQSKGTDHFLRNFYIRRVLRIFPLYFFTLLLFLVILPLLIRIPELDYYLDNQLWMWLYLQNWLFILNPPPDDSLMLAHLWSLAVEEQFYLVWPFVILLLKTPSRMLLLSTGLLIMVIAVRFYLWVNRIESISYYNLYTFSRIDGICIGSMLAILHKINRNAIARYFTAIILFLAALNFLFYFFNHQYQYSYPYLAIVGYSTFAVLFALLVNEGITSDNLIVKLLFENKVMVFFGKISFSLYVFHLPLYLILSPKIAEWSGIYINWMPSNAFTSVVISIFACLLAWLSFYYIERRFLSLKRHFAYTLTWVYNPNL